MPELDHFIVNSQRIFLRNRCIKHLATFIYAAEEEL